jgi:hypothetical protein
MNTQTRPAEERMKALQILILMEIEKLSKNIELYNLRNQNKNIHYGHVGDMAHILEQLKEINQFQN